MISIITSDTVPQTSDSYYGYKIRSYFKAYGPNFNFCRFYKCEDSVIMIYNSTMVIDNSKVSDEIISFIELINPVSIEIRCNHGITDLSGYKQHVRKLFKFNNANIQINNKELKINCCLDKIFPIVEEGFGIKEYDEWYVDISHRIRHNTANIYLYKDSVTATMQFNEADFAFFSHIATSAESRGKGYARELLYILSGMMKSQNSDAYLFALEHRVTFYEEIGFIPVYSDILFEK